jgi:hypothetical protein
MARRLEDIVDLESFDSRRLRTIAILNCPFRARRLYTM